MMPKASQGYTTKYLADSSFAITYRHCGNNSGCIIISEWLVTSPPARHKFKYFQAVTMLSTGEALAFRLEKVPHQCWGVGRCQSAGKTVGGCSRLRTLGNLYPTVRRSATHAVIRSTSPFSQNFAADIACKHGRLRHGNTILQACAPHKVQRRL